jgi:3-hydroxyacyl-CoA dehydrogenase
VKALFLAKDRAGEFLRATLGPTLLYAARIAPDVAASIDDIDRAMRWGFGWELGPFETWDAIGIREVLGAVDVAPKNAPDLVAKVLAAGRNTFRDGPAARGATRLRHPQGRTQREAPLPLERGRVARSISATASLR